VNKAQVDGANILTGGKRLTRGAFQKGYWFEPTVLTSVKQSMEIMQKEIFGPVLPIMPFSDLDEAIQLANDSPYGLAGFFFSNDINRIMKAVGALDVGELYINRTLGESIHGYHTGRKLSRIGGDDGKYGLDHYLNNSTVISSC